MAGWHQTVVVGNLGRDPELRYLPNGTAVCNFSVAITETWGSEGERKEKTTWYKVSVFGAQAESCSKFLAKGRQVMVVGTVDARSYKNNAGEAAASLDLRARDVRFLGGRGDGASDGGGDDDYEPQMTSEMGDIPF